MKKAIIAASVATLLSTSAVADTLLGLYIGGSVWQTETEGSFGQATGPSASQQNFNYKDQTNGNYYIALEHPIPLVPNIKFSSTDIATTGTTTLSGDFLFGNTTFDDTTSATTDLDISYVDYTFYYEVFDNGIFSFDMGLTARDFDGIVAVTGTDTSNAAQSEELKPSGIIPMIYVATNIGIPSTDFSVFAEGNLLSMDDHTVYDYQAGVSYAVLDNMAVDFNLTLGYRAVKVELDDLDSLSTVLDYKGLFAGAVVHF